MQKQPVLLSLILFFIPYSIFAQQEEKKLFEHEIFAMHPRAGLIYNMHMPDFQTYEGLFNCGRYTEGSSAGNSVFLTFEKALSERLQIGIGIGFTDRSAEMEINDTVPVFDPVLQQPVTANTIIHLDNSLNMFEIVPEVRYVLIKDLISGPLRIAGAFRFGFANEYSFEQYETIKSPDNAVFFVDEKRTQQRDIASGNITTLNSPVIGVSAGIENMLRISDKHHFTQQVIFDYNLNDFTSDASWGLFAARIELGFRFSFRDEPVEIPEPLPEPEPEPVVVEKEPEPEPIPVITLDLIEDSINVTLKTGNELVATLPFVNAVFFETNESGLKDYYVTRDTEIDRSDLNSVEAHRYVLPRIADIIKKNPGSEITLIGATSGAENERGGVELARGRAETVKNALVSLGISSDRITTKARLLPEYPSNMDFEEGVLENQRVDIDVKDAPLQEYVNIQRYAKVEGSIHFSAEFENIPEDDKVVLTTSLSDTMKTIPSPGIYSMAIESRVPNDLEYLNFESRLASDMASDEVKSVIDVDDLEKEQVELNLDNFEAILRFDYDSSVLSKENKQLLRQLTEKLPEGSSIIIYGSADILGSEERNIQLERERAQNKKEFIKSAAPGKFDIKTRTGIKKFPDDNIPGRFLNRSIRIRVEE